MSDPRLTPDPSRITQRTPAMVTTSLSTLRRAPDGPRDRQLLFGDAVTVLADDGGWSYVQAEKDSYCGYLRSDTLAAPQAPTHVVSAPATHAYQAADFKSPDVLALSFGSRLCVQGSSGNFAQTEAGFVPMAHLSPIATVRDDPAAVAKLFLGTPYLWGGNSRWGIDCSGLVQAALLACGHPCPGDSDQQQSVGTAVTGTYRRNDLLFWKGHVALVWDGETLIHANAGSMSTRLEGITETCARIAAAGDGPLTGHRRLS